jgi:hypothetical protein
MAGFGDGVALGHRNLHHGYLNGYFSHPRGFVNARAAEECWPSASLDPALGQLSVTSDKPAGDAFQCGWQFEAA